MSQSQPDEAREVGSPVRFFGSMSNGDGFDKDFSPRPVSVDDIHPTELEVEAGPKALTSSVSASAETYSDLIPESPEGSVSVAPESPHEPPVDPPSSEDPPLPSSSTSTKSGAPALPVPPSAPPATPTSSSPDAGK